jgi:hypothetical protein
MNGHSFARIGIVFAILAIAAATPATAQVISIRSGTFTTDNSLGGRLDISGTQGFTLQAAMTDGINEPFASCRLGICPPGELEIHVRSIGNDLPGTATLRGNTYADLGGLVSPNSADIMITGQIGIPPVGNQPVTVTAPFDFAGLFFYAESENDPPQEARLIGGGQVTFHLAPASGGTEWTATSAVFEFTRRR